MKKQTPIDFRTSDNKKVTVIVNRTWGYEPHIVRMSDDISDPGNEEGLPMMKFNDTVDFSARVNGKKYETVRIVPSYFSPSNLGLELDPETVIDLPQKVWDKIRELKEERLNDEISPRIVDRIKTAKECMAKGHVLPEKELKKKMEEDWEIKEGELMSLFSPFYTDWISVEEVSELKRKYPEQFRVELTREYVGGKIREAREKAGLTLRALAEKTGLTYSHIARIEKGEHNVSLDTLATLLNTLGLSFEIV